MWTWEMKEYSMNKKSLCARVMRDNKENLIVDTVEGRTHMEGFAGRTQVKTKQLRNLSTDV